MEVLQAVGIDPLDRVHKFGFSRIPARCPFRGLPVCGFVVARTRGVGCLKVMTIAGIFCAW
jgi:hypothetical protein